MKKQWTKEQLKKFSQADDMHVSPFYTDGKTYGTPTWIWSVVVDGNLYIRAYNGQNSRWYQAAISQKAGKIKLANHDFKSVFENVSDNSQLNQKINDAYTIKYKNSPYLPAMLASGPTSSTVRILPY